MLHSRRLPRQIGVALVALCSSANCYLAPSHHGSRADYRQHGGDIAGVLTSNGRRTVEPVICRATL
jgi:hypothetical protein